MPAQPKYYQIPMPPTHKPQEQEQESITQRPHPPIPKPKPLLRLEFRDLSEEGAQSFLSLPDCHTILQEAVDGVLSLLYTSSSVIPPTRSVTLILRSMGGVAYTTGKDIDSDHKEIHFSTDYIAGVPKDRRKQEMLGVVRHEMVHCWQWAARGSCPGGLIEGIADWVRLRSGLVPPHWKQECTGDWDAGYQHTGYFLDYLETRFGHGTVVKINERLRDRDYDEDDFWRSCCGHHVKKLWKDYGRSLGVDGEEGREEGREEEEVDEDDMGEKKVDASNTTIIRSHASEGSSKSEDGPKVESRDNKERQMLEIQRQIAALSAEAMKLARTGERRAIPFGTR